MSSIEELTAQSRDAILAQIMDMGRACTSEQYIARTEIARLQAALDELVKAAEPFVTMADDYGPFEGAEYVALQTSNVLIRVGDLRSLSEAVARAKKEGK